MAGKIINTLKYGDKRTKGKLYLMFGILALGTAGLLLALLFSNVFLGILAFLALLIDGLVLINASFTKKEISMKRENREKPVQWKAEAKTEKKAERKTEGEDAYGALEWIPSEKKEEKKEADFKKESRQGKEERFEKEENPLISYDEKKLKKAMVAYKVKREHVPIMIDYCPTERISQCPAYAWRDTKYVYFLLLESEPRMIKAELSEIDGIHIRRGIMARPSQEYPDMKEKSMISKLFSEYLPNYYQTNQDGYRAEFRKNMYSVAPGVWCTAASVKNIMKLLPGKFILDDSKIEAESSYYQDVHISRVLFWDGVYTAGEYKDKVIETLTHLADADMSMDTFHNYLAKMILKGLIPQEYADYAMNRRAVK